ncbi:MAG: hypothetical protein ACOC34_02660 [Thermotogota bacterium]
MRKTIVFVVMGLILFSLSGCVVFQKVMNVSGNWIVELENLSAISQMRAIVNEPSSSRATWVYAPLKITQNGNTLTGTLYLLNFETSVSGTIGEDDSFEIEGSLPLMDSQRIDERAASIFVMNGKATGNKSLFNKLATKIEGKFYPKSNPSDYIEFEATR